MLIWKDAVLEIHRSPLYQTLSSAVITADCRLLVDPAWLPEEVEHLQAWVATQRPDLPLYVLFTHADYDHILGAGAFPEAHTIGVRDAPDRRTGRTCEGSGWREVQP